MKFIRAMHSCGKSYRVTDNAIGKLYCKFCKTKKGFKIINGRKMMKLNKIYWLWLIPTIILIVAAIAIIYSLANPTYIQSIEIKPNWNWKGV